MTCFFKEVLDYFRTLYWWQIFDPYDTSPGIADLSFQTDNREQHIEGTICARRL
jgi:hypothetical protein